jgi:hypothetical protein
MPRRNTNGIFSVAEMPNDTAPKKTGSSENGYWDGNHDLPCDLANAQLRLVWPGEGGVARGHR